MTHSKDGYDEVVVGELGVRCLESINGRAILCEFEGYACVEGGVVAVSVLLKDDLGGVRVDVEDVRAQIASIGAWAFVIVEEDEEGLGPKMGAIEREEDKEGLGPKVGAKSSKWGLGTAAR
jgi:hypothetical protein